MTAPLTSPAAVVNAAIQLIGGYNNNGAVTGTPPNFDGSKLGIAAGAVYDEIVQSIGRAFAYDFSRKSVSLGAVTPNTPRFGFAFEYLYPDDTVQLRQIMPPANSDPNNPLPLTWLVGNAVVLGVPKKVVWTSVPNAAAEISNAPPEGLWDALYQEAVVRELGSKLAMAGFGKPDLMRELLEYSARSESQAQVRDS